jgi:hypothetical protein
MLECPPDLLAALPKGAEAIAKDWWSSLSDADRKQISGMWDQRLEVKFFSPQPSDVGQADSWEQVPEVEGGRFVPTDDTRGLKEWGPSYFEHLLQHPELVLVWEPEHRTFHIGCTQHADARKCLTSREVPVNFRCPLELARCPLKSLRGSRFI